MLLLFLPTLSNAPLLGMGVGNSSATATQAMLLSVLQDVFGRITSELSLNPKIYFSQSPGLQQLLVPII